MAKTIHQLELHESSRIENTIGEIYSIMRVSGGWIYTKIYRNGNIPDIMTFVPYNKEFMKDGDVVIPAFDENKEI